MAFATTLALFIPQTLHGRIEDDGDHTQRDPSVLLPGNSGRPEFDGKKFPTRSAFFFATDTSRIFPSGIPGSVSLLALKLKSGTKPETLFAAVDKLKKAEGSDRQLEAARELARILGPEGVKAFTDERTKKLDVPALLRALTLLENDEDVRKARDGVMGRRQELLSKELERLASATPPAPPERPRDPNGGTGSAPPAPEPKNPGEPPGNGNGEGIGSPPPPTEPPVVPPGDGLGIGIGAGNDNPFNDDLQNLLNENEALRDALERQQLQNELDRERERNANNNKNNKEPGTPPNDSNGQPLPLAQPGSGGAPNLSRQKLEVPPAEIARPIAPPPFQMPQALPDAQLSGDAVDKLSGGALPPAPKPGDAFDKLMSESAQLRQSGLDLLQSIYARIGASQNQAPPQLTTPTTGAQGARTVGDVLRTPGLFQSRGPQTITPPSRYGGTGLPGSFVGTGTVTGQSTARPPQSIGPVSVQRVPGTVRTNRAARAARPEAPARTVRPQ